MKNLLTALILTFTLGAFGQVTTAPQTTQEEPLPDYEMVTVFEYLTEMQVINAGYTQEVLNVMRNASNVDDETDENGFHYTYWIRVVDRNYGEMVERVINPATKEEVYSLIKFIHVQNG